jgi:trimeric autotransporter adhesin
MKISTYLQVVTLTSLLMNNEVLFAQDSYYAGYQAGTYSTGFYNTFVGAHSGRSNTGSRNSFFGIYTGGNNTGSDNAFFGANAGNSNTSGFANTFIGVSAGISNGPGNGNTFVGYYSGRNNKSNRNVFVGVSAGEKNTSGGDNTFVGRTSGMNNITGYGNTALGLSAGPSVGNLTNATAIGYKAYVTKSHALVLGSVNGANGATNTVKVGIGTTAPGYLLHVNGVAAKPGGGSWTVASDKKLKREIEPYKEGLEQISRINPVWYRYNGKAGLPTDKKYVGIIAQEMKEIAPYTIEEFVYSDSTGKEEKFLDYDANALTYMLVNAVKELKNSSEKQAALIEQQALVIEELTAKVASLEQPGGQNESSTTSSGAKLWQNYPNPYGTSTIIRYYVPPSASSAQLRIITATGQEIFTTALPEREQGQIEISNQFLSAGSYIYQLIVDGAVADHKKMTVGR